MARNRRLQSRRAHGCPRRAGHPARTEGELLGDNQLTPSVITHGFPYTGPPWYPRYERCAHTGSRYAAAAGTHVFTNL